MQETERSDLLEQYRSLSLEAERFETATHQLESEGSNLRLEMMTRDSEIRRLADKVDMLERDIQEVGVVCRTWIWWELPGNGCETLEIVKDGSTLIWECPGAHFNINFSRLMYFHYIYNNKAVSLLSLIIMGIPICTGKTAPSYWSWEPVLILDLGMCNEYISFVPIYQTIFIKCAGRQTKCYLDFVYLSDSDCRFAEFWNPFLLFTPQRIRLEHSYEMQVSSLTKSVAAQEDALRAMDHEKQSLLQDLAAVRDLCTKLEITKDNLHRQLTAKTLDTEKVCG